MSEHSKGAARAPLCPHRISPRFYTTAGAAVATVGPKIYSCCSPTQNTARHSAVCEDGYRKLSAGQLCVSCEGGWSSGARVTLWLLVVAAPLALVALVVFLVGGPPAALQVRFRGGRG